MNNEKLLENLRCIPDFPQKGVNFRDVTTLFKDPECLKIMVDELYELYKDKGITKIVGIESRGFVLSSALALKLNAGVVLCRKPGKLPAETIQESYSKEYGKLYRTNQIGTVNDKLMHKLNVEAPPKILVERYLIEIAKNYNVPYEPDSVVMVSLVF